MKIFRGLAEYTKGSHPALTIGNFDGQHRGHIALLQKIVAAASSVHGTACVLTFDPHPLRILKPELDLRFLTSPEEKLARFQEVGVDEVVFLEFNTALAGLTPEEFVLKILRDGIGAREVFVGEAFAFGKHRAGCLNDLQRLASVGGFQVHPVPAVTVDGEVVSSSRIRRLIHAGEVKDAARCLGRAYALSGPVVSGHHRGRALGWPTANLALPPGRVIPADGVYAARARYRRDFHDAVAYIGTRPTFGAGERLIEVYLLGQELNLYGGELGVEFVEWLRGDMTFATAEELSARIDHDVDMARKSLQSSDHTPMESRSLQRER